MAFKFENISVADVREQYATSRDTMLSQVCRNITDAFKDPEMEATPLLTLEQLEQMDDKFQNWQIRQRDRRANPQDEKDKTAQVISVDAIARKINAEKDTTDVRARRVNGGILFVRNSLWTAEDEDEA
jgi:hypothetical protein